MPSKITTPRFALSAEFDAREWSGVALYHKEALGVAGATVSAPTFGDGEGLYKDAVAFLNGYGCPALRGLNNDLTQQWAARGGDPKDVSIFVNEDDLLEIRILDALNSIAVAADAENAPFGFDTAGHAAQAGNGSIVAVDDFVRGVLLLDGATRPPRLTLTHSLGGADIVIPRYAAYEQSMIHALRPRGEIEDIDDVNNGSTLEDFDNAVYDPLAGNAGNRNRWGITEDGYVYHTVRKSETNKDLVWESATFRDRLGFTGDEIASSTGFDDDLDVWVTVADNPLPGFVTPKRKIRRMDESLTEHSAAQTLLDGSSSVTRLAQHFGWDISLTLLGHDLRRGVGFDEVRHWYRAIRPYLYRGDRVTLFPEWGEFRRAIRDAEVNEDQGAYDGLYTSDRDGYRGRYQCKLDNDTPERSVAAYEGTANNNRIRHQIDLSLTVLGEE